jgi:hypothetical protein
MGACRMARFLFRPGTLDYASETEGIMCQRQPDLQEKWRRAAENREYVRRLLAEKQPAFAAAVRAAERHLERELSACHCGLAVTAGRESAHESREFRSGPCTGVRHVRDHL